MIAQPELIAAHDLTSSEAFRRALDTAAQKAAEVDRDANFPFEAVQALRAAGAFGWAVPRKYGGAGANFDEIAAATFQLSRRCTATGMIFAMHQIQVACIVRHCGSSRWFSEYLERLVREQRLIASATSEAGVGGDIRRSIAAIHPAADSNGLEFEKQAPTISYGLQADDVLTTLRRGPQADQGDQVLALTHVSEMDLTPTSEWDTMGMRGTCSPGFSVRARLHPDQVLPEPFSTISVETMVPVAHILWAHVWLGLSMEAFHRAQNFVRDQALRTPGTTPPSALRLSELSALMAQFRALVRSALSEYMNLADGEERQKLSTVGYAVRINNLKIAASEAAVDICERALRVCGIMGYKNGGPYSVGRYLRDAYSAALMIANDRLHATNAALLLVHREAQ